MIDDVPLASDFLDDDEQSSRQSVLQALKLMDCL